MTIQSKRNPTQSPDKNLTFVRLADGAYVEVTVGEAVRIVQAAIRGDMVEVKLLAGQVAHKKAG